MDDKKAKPHPSGFVVVTPRGVQEHAHDQQGSAARPARLIAETEPLLADSHIQAFRLALAPFGSDYWTLTQVLSWIAYRSPCNLDVPHLRGVMYPMMPGVPNVIEPAASSTLLQALRRTGNTLKAFAVDTGVEIPRARWGAVVRVNDPKSWPESIFAREDVLREWPEAPGTEREDHNPLQSLTEEPRSVELSRADRIRAATKTLPRGLKREDKSARPRRYPFAEALTSAFGEPLIGKEWKAELDFYAPEAKPGRPKNAEK